MRCMFYSPTLMPTLLSVIFVNKEEISLSDSVAPIQKSVAIDREKSHYQNICKANSFLRFGFSCLMRFAVAKNQY
jgi:hypothetical protein